MIIWTKKRYLKELKKGYWGIEPHFNYYSLIEAFDLFETAVENKMNSKDITSALYGKFVMEGKPMKKGFINHMNLISELLRTIINREKKNGN